jgi:hypothetical protein
MLNLIKLCFVYAGCNFFYSYAQCRYAKWCYAECHGARQEKRIFEREDFKSGKGGFFAKEEKSFKLLIILQKRSFQIGWKEKDHCNLVDHSGQVSEKVTKKKIFNTN